MSRQSIPLKDVKINSRMRKDLGSIPTLADSIRRNGLIQPIVLTPSFELVAGERRYRAHEFLGLTHVDYVLVADLPPDLQAELEFEENFYRKSMTWVEEALGMLDIYRKKKRRGALEGFSENWQMTISEMFSISIGNVNYILAVAAKLEKELPLPLERRRYHNFQSVSEAYRLGILAEREDAANMILANRGKSAVNTTGQELMNRRVVEEVKQLESSPDLLAEAREKYQSNPLNTIPFDQYFAERKREADEVANTMYLSNRIINVHCIAWMNDPVNAGTFDHIITDPPYAIDMDNLNQQNQHGGMNDIDRIIDAHQVDENIDLLKRFFPAAYACTRDKAFVAVCGDVMLWELMYESAVKAGFAVQRWPLIWRKVNQSVMNNCSGYNTTKDYEIVMICRKPGATLAKKLNTSIIDASNTEVKKIFGHPFSKPFELTQAILELVSIESQTILEPFAGGGSMTVQMLKAKRHVVALEKEEHHYNALLENVKQQYYLKLNPRFIFK